MGRAAKYTDQSILDAALGLISEGGTAAATVTAIAQRLGAPSGSIYHRFPSRDLLLATLWLRTVREFQSGFLSSLENDDPLTAARDAVRHTLEWTSAHPSEAAVLSMHRREDLIARWPEELGDELRRLNVGVELAIRRFAAAHFGEADPVTLGRAQFALVQIPYAAVRGALRGGGIPDWLPESVIAASLAVLTTGVAATGSV